MLISTKIDSFWSKAQEYEHIATKLQTAIVLDFTQETSIKFFYLTQESNLI